MAAARFPGPLPPQELARHCAAVIGELAPLTRSPRVSPAIDPRTASALIDLDAFVANIETLRRTSRRRP